MRSPPCFHVQRRRTRQTGSSWRAAALILRADTDEVVARLGFRAESAAEAEALLEAAIAEALATLPPPADWGRDPTVPRLMARYLTLRDEVYGRVLYADPEARAYDERETAKLAAQVEALGEAQRLELATADPAVLDNLLDPWNLDEVTARRELCRMLSQRSAAVQAGVERLHAVLARE